MISSDIPTLTHLIIHPLHLNETHFNSYSVPFWPSGNRSSTSLDHPLEKPFLFVTVLMNKLVLWCAWLLSNALEVVRLRLRFDAFFIKIAVKLFAFTAFTLYGANCPPLFIS